MHASAPCKKTGCHHPPPLTDCQSQTSAKSTGWMRIQHYDLWWFQRKCFRPVRNTQEPLQARSFRPAKKVTKVQPHNSKINVLSMRLWLTGTHQRLLAIPGANRHLVTVSMKPPLVVGQVKIIKLSIRLAIRRIRLSPSQKPQEVLITNRSLSWKLLTEALEGSPSVTMEARQKIATGGTRSMRSEVWIKLPCTVLHSLPRHHLLMEMVRAIKHQISEVTELMDVYQLIRLVLPQPARGTRQDQQGRGNARVIRHLRQIFQDLR